MIPNIFKLSDNSEPTDGGQGENCDPWRFDNLFKQQATFFGMARTYERY